MIGTSTGAVRPKTPYGKAPDEGVARDETRLSKAGKSRKTPRGSSTPRDSAFRADASFAKSGEAKTRDPYGMCAPRKQKTSPAAKAMSSEHANAAGDRASIFHTSQRADSLLSKVVDELTAVDFSVADCRTTAELAKARTFQRMPRLHLEQTNTMGGQHVGSSAGASATQVAEVEQGVVTGAEATALAAAIDSIKRKSAVSTGEELQHPEIALEEAAAPLGDRTPHAAKEGMTPKWGRGLRSDQEEAMAEHQASKAVIAAETRALAAEKRAAAAEKRAAAVEGRLAAKEKELQRTHERHEAVATSNDLSNASAAGTPAPPQLHLSSTSSTPPLVLIKY